MMAGVIALPSGVSVFYNYSTSAPMVAGVIALPSGVSVFYNYSTSAPMVAGVIALPSVPEFIDPVLGVKMIVFAKTSPKRSFSI
jgi:hypothetical protein